MNITSLTNEKFVDKNGHLTPVARALLEQLINQLQINLSDEGYILPQQDNANVTLLNTNQSKGALLYNNETNEAMVNIENTFKDLVYV